MKKILLVGTAGLLIGVGGFYLVRQSILQSAAVGTSQPIKVGAALCLTGDCAEWGEGELKSIQLAIDETNKNGGVAGRQVQLVAEDILDEPKGAVNAMRKLIDIDHVEAVVGITWGDSFQAGFTVSNAAHVVAVAPSATLESLWYNKQPTDYVFSTWVPIQPEIDALQAYMQKEGATNVAVLHDRDPFGLMVSSVFAASADKHGLTIEKENEFPSGYDDFRTVITQLKSTNVDAVFTEFQSAAPKAKFLKQAHELGFTPHFYSTEDIQNEALLKEFGSVLEGVVYVYPEASGDAASYQEKFEKRYGTPTGSSWLNAYDAAQAVLTALKEHYENGTDIKTAVETINIPGVFSKEVRFNAQHQITGAEFQIKTIKNGQFVVVE